MDVFIQGLKYTANSFVMDPLTLALALWGRSRVFILWTRKQKKRGCLLWG